MTEKFEFYGRMVTTKQYNKIINEAAIHHLRQAIKYLQGKRLEKPINLYAEAVEKAKNAINNIVL